MHTRKLACALMLAGIVAAAPAATGEIYKWTDAEGNVHYGDRPTGAGNEERLAISSSRTDPARVQATVQARQEARTRREESRANAAAGQPSEEELRAEAEERARKCETYRERLQKFVTSRRLYRHDENGERVYLDEAETEAARARVQEQVQEYCGS
jgi:hypothetical protein